MVRRRRRRKSGLMRAGVGGRRPCAPRRVSGAVVPPGPRRQAPLAPLRAGTVLGRRSRGFRRSGAGLDRDPGSRDAGGRRGHGAGGRGRARRRTGGVDARPDAHRGQHRGPGQDRCTDQRRAWQGAMPSGLRNGGGLAFRLISAMKVAVDVVVPPGGRRVRRGLGPCRAAGAVRGSPGAPGRARSVVAVHHALRIEGSHAIAEGEGMATNGIRRSVGCGRLWPQVVSKIC